jgi:hypothetical protein
MSGTGLRCEVREKRVTRGDAINRDASCVFGFASFVVDGTGGPHFRQRVSVTDLAEVK